MNGPESLQFVDTNVLVYAHDTSAREKRTRAVALLDDLWASGQGCLSIQVLQEFYVTVTRKVPQPLSPRSASQIIEDLATWRLHEPDVEDVLDAIRFQETYRISFWDAMIVTSAMRLGCGLLWSEDLNTGQDYGPVTVRSPFQ
jgi:predicted nucleic acid-binding protein